MRTKLSLFKQFPIESWDILTTTEREQVEEEQQLNNSYGLWLSAADQKHVYHPQRNYYYHEMGNIVDQRTDEQKDG